MYSGIKNFLKKGLLFLIMLLILSSLFACSKSEVPSETTDYLISVNDEEVQQNEVMIYVYQVVEEFQSIGGEEVWEFEDFSGGKSAIQVAKEAVLENVVRIKVLNKKSIELNVKLDEKEVAKVNEQALVYLEKMSTDYRSTYGITEETLIHVFHEFAVADKVISDITNDFQPSDDIINTKLNMNEEYSRLKNLDTNDLLTQINVYHIQLDTREKGIDGKYSSIIDIEKNKKLMLAHEIAQKAAAEADFKQLMKDYSEEVFTVESEDNGIYQFSKALLPEQFKAGIENLAIDEVSQIIESDAGYHIFKVIDIYYPTDKEIQSFEENFLLYEENLKEAAVESLKKDAFDNLYTKWKESFNVSINKEAWDIISLQI